MKKFLLIGSMVAALTLLAGFAIPVFAHRPAEEETAAEYLEAWETMHEACEEGDWEAMAEIAEQVHRGDVSSMPCHGEGDYSSKEGVRAPSDGSGGMGGGMRGGNWGGMMGW
jgi:hypothetical protein